MVSVEKQEDSSAVNSSNRKVKGGLFHALLSCD